MCYYNDMNYRFVVFDGFWSEYWWIILVCALGGAAIGAVIAYFITYPKKKKVAVDVGGCMDALGGPDNVLTKSCQGSRIVLTCKDYGIIDRQALKKAGVTGFIQSEDKLTLVVKGGASAVYASLFPEA